MTHRCVDCLALPERRTPDASGLTDEEIEARFAAVLQHESRPLRPRAIDPRSEPPRCYTHLARARRRWG